MLSTFRALLKKIIFEVIQKSQLSIRWQLNVNTFD